jgi:KDO2-lipid IV(A) lauroyltransferase
MKALMTLFGLPIIVASAFFPLALNRMLGMGIGKLIWRLNTGPRSVANTNLKLCFPDESPKQFNRLLQASLMHAAQGVMETGSMWFRPSKMNESLCVEAQGVETLDAAITESKRQKSGGVLLLMPHLGGWEFAPSYLIARFGKGLNALYAQRTDNSRFEGQVVAFLRMRRGLTQHPTTNAGIRGAVRALSKGEPMLVLPDHEPRRNAAAVEIPFFALKKARTATLSTRLAKYAHEKVFFIYVLRVRKGFKIHVEPLSGLSKLGAREGAVLINQAIERAVKQDRSQYLWTYKRFKQYLYHYQGWKRYP